MCKMILWSLEKGDLGGSTNYTFLALIPKEKNPNSVERFKPIYLWNTSYNILTKILATRMRYLMKHIISDSQGGFVIRRQILDNIIIVQEVIHSSIERTKQGMEIKLDMANTFDRVNHFFLFEIMSRIFFSKRFIRWTKACISSPRILLH